MLFLHSKQGKEDDIPDGRRIGKDHDPAIDADPLAGRGRHSEFEGPEEILVEAKIEVCLLELLLDLPEETLPLVKGIVQLGKTVGNLPARDEELEPVHDGRVLRIPAGKG